MYIDFVLCSLYIVFFVPPGGCPFFPSRCCVQDFAICVHVRSHLGIKQLLKCPWPL